MKRFGNAVKVIFLLSTIVLSFTTQLWAASLTQEEIEQLAAEITAVTGREFTTIPVIKDSTDSEVMVIFDIEQQVLNKQLNEVGQENHSRNWVIGSLLGKYSWVTKEIYLVGNTMNLYARTVGTDEATLEKVVVIHELVHALDDQYFDLNKLLSKIKDQESTLAIGALIEGHAMFIAQQVYQRLNLDPEIIKKYWNSDSYEGNTLGVMYLKGYEFVSYVLNNSVLTAEDLFRNPLLQTELLLEPEKYLRGEYQSCPDLAGRFDADFIASLPWYFKYQTTQIVDKMSMLMGLKILGANEGILKGYRTGYSMQFAERVYVEPKEVLPLVVSDLLDVKKGFFTVSIMHFDQPEDLRGFFEYCKANNQTQWNVDDKGTVQLKYTKLQTQYPDSYLNFQTIDKLGSLVYFLPVVRNNYVVEIVIANLNVTEEFLLQIVSEIEKRLE